MMDGWTLQAFRQAVLVGIGGFVGSVLRFAVSGLVQRLDPSGAFPYGTLAVNTIGCLVIGLLGGVAESRQVVGPELRLLLFLGLLGGFTTVSSFSFETLALARDGEQLKAGVNVVATIVLSLTAVWIGHGVGSSR